MTSVVITSLGERKGTPRIWMEGIKLFRGGFKPGDMYEIREQSKGKIVLARKGDGDRTVSKRTRGGKIFPIIDLNFQALAECFDVGAKLRMVIRRGAIVIRAHWKAAKVADRVERILKKLREKQALETGSIFHGGGILDVALHSGMRRSGSSSFVKVAVERERKYLDYSVEMNKHLFSGETIFVEAEIQDLGIEGIPTLDFLSCGLPCTGFSVAGKAKNKITHGEEHDEAGAMFYYFLRWVEASNPACWLLECVSGLQNSATMAAIRSVMKSLGYLTQEKIVEGNEFGALESRKRICVVGITEGLEDVFDLDAVTSLHQKPETLGEVLEDIDPAAPCWRDYKYLVEKEERDQEKGNSFQRQLFDGSDTKISVLRRLYNKGGSTDPVIKHPTDPLLARLLTCVEHARVKGIPEWMADPERGAPAATTMHEIFGQSVCFPVFEAIGYHFAKALQSIAQDDALYAGAAEYAKRTTYAMAA